MKSWYKDALSLIPRKSLFVLEIHTYKHHHEQKAVGNPEVKQVCGYAYDSRLSMGGLAPCVNY